MMPNPWESSSFQLKSTLDHSAAASLMPTARLIDVMLCLSHPMGKGEFTTNLRSSPKVSTMIGEGMGDSAAAIRGRLAPKVFGEGGAAELSNTMIAQFLCSPVAPRTRACRREFTCSGMFKRERRFFSRSRVGLAATQASG
jgi:hypothetical protein